MPLQHLHAYLCVLGLGLPGVELDVQHLRTAEQVSLMRTGALDAGLIDDVVDADDIETEPIFPPEPLLAYLPFDHALADKQSVEPGDVERETLLLFPRRVDPELYHWYARLGQDDLFRFRAAQAVGGADPRDVLLAVGEGRGITLGPHSLLHSAGELRALIAGRRLEPPRVSPGIALARPARVPAAAHDRGRLAQNAARQIRANFRLPGTESATDDRATLPVAYSSRSTR